MAEHLKTLSSLADPSSDSEAVISKRCLSDDEVLAFVKGQIHPSQMQRVHGHLDSCAECQQLLSEAAHALDAEPISESARRSWNTVFQSGALIARRYRILRLIARGGMGEVYEAFDTALHDRVALKTVTATHCDNPDAVRLLKAEVQHARRIGHPNVCRIFDLGTHVIDPSGGEIQFLVMEFVEGECLGKKLRHSGALPLDLALSVAEQLLRGLAAAHQAGILHRDFKSDNVILRTECGGKAKAIILDFGLAKALNESGSIVTTQQHGGQAMAGTIGYMAPEQIEGELLSAASDIYSLGVVWFEMLTGRLPFEAETAMASAVMRLHRTPEPPSRYNPAVPAWLDAIVLRCLERHQVARFASAERVLAELSARPTSASPASASKPTLRKRPILILLGISVLVLASIGMVRVHRPPASPRYVPRQPLASLTRPAQLSSSQAPRGPSSVEQAPGPAQTRAKPKPKSRKPDKPRDAPATPPPTPPGPPAQAAPPVEPKPEVSGQDSKAVSKSEPDWLPLRKPAPTSEPPPQVD